MKYLTTISTLVLVLAILAISAGQAFSDKGFRETELQQRFARSVQSMPEVIQASWQSQVDLWVYADGVSKEGAQALAEKVIILSHTEYGQGLCVHVHNGNYQPIANKCSGT